MGVRIRGVKHTGCSMWLAPDESHFGNAAHAKTWPTAQFLGKVHVQPDLKLTPELANVIAALLQVPRQYDADGSGTQVYSTTVGNVPLVGFWTIEDGEEHIYIGSESSLTQHDE